jgi:N-acetylglutamate synthase-like GNAT family acetyltransferase
MVFAARLPEFAQLQKGTKMSVRIAYLADYPEAVPLLARLHHTEWADLLPDWSLDEATAELRTHAGRRQIPTTFIALAEEQLIGSASLLVTDLAGWEKLTPWLASVYVRPEWRRRGIGRRLVEHAVEDVRALAIPTVYLWTPDRQDYYLRLGWQFVASAECHGTAVAVMRRETAAAVP